MTLTSYKDSFMLLWPVSLAEMVCINTLAETIWSIPTLKLHHLN